MANHSPRRAARVPALSAELAARCTAAAAILADYTADVPTADTAGRALWAARLADALGYVLGALAGDTPPGATPAVAYPGGGWISGPCETPQTPPSPTGKREPS